MCQILAFSNPRHPIPSHPIHPPPPDNGLQRGFRDRLGWDCTWVRVCVCVSMCNVEGGGCLAARGGVSLVECGAFLDLFTGVLMAGHDRNVVVWRGLFDSGPRCVGGCPRSCATGRETCGGGCLAGLAVYCCHCKRVQCLLRSCLPSSRNFWDAQTVGGVPFDPPCASCWPIVCFVGDNI